MTGKQKERKETNMNWVRMIAKDLLSYEIIRTEQSPLVIHHPFTGHGVLILPGDPPLATTDITASTENLERWKEWMRSRLEKAESDYEIGMMVHQPYRLVFLAYTGEHLSDREFAKLLHFSWFRSMPLSYDEGIEPHDMIEMFQRANAEYLMSPEERSILAQLPDEAVIYRGLTDKNAFHVSGMSWTLEEESAARFARRGEFTGKVYRAKIRKEEILALFLKGDEIEIIVDPKNLQEIALYLLVLPEAELAAENKTPEPIREKNQEGVMRYDFW